MKGIIEASVYLILFAFICMFSIDFIRINRDEYIEYTFSYKLKAAMFAYSSWHQYKGLARYCVTE